MLQGSNVVEKIYRYLYSEYKNHFSVSGLMGMLYTKSGLDPMSVDDKLKKALKQENSFYCTDHTYTDAVDEGLITRDDFIHPKNHRYTYGIAGWITVSEKSDLYDIAKAKRKSIGDLEIQLSLLIQDIEVNYGKLHETLRTAKSLRTVVDVLLKKYDRNDAPSEKEKSIRLAISQKYYDMFASVVHSAQPIKGFKPATAESKNDSRFKIGDKVSVTGKMYTNGRGTGDAVDKKDEIMYVVGLADSSRYPYSIGLSNTKDGVRKGWASPADLSFPGAPKVIPGKEVIANEYPNQGSSDLIGQYAASVQVYIRNGAGTFASPLVSIPAGHLVTCTKGGYADFKGVKWLYVEAIHEGIKYKGFCSSEYLVKL